jgi:hypothetical protein
MVARVQTNTAQQDGHLAPWDHLEPVLASGSSGVSLLFSRSAGAPIAPVPPRSLTATSSWWPSSCTASTPPN